MLCPQKVLRMNEFSRDIVNGIIWDEVRERKTHPGVLFKMGLQQQLGVSLNRELVREEEILKLDRELNKDSRMDEESEADRRKKLDKIEKDNVLHKDLFINSQRKQEFFQVAKEFQNNRVIKQQNLVHALSYVNFFKKCQKSGTLALPIFSKARD